jgi:ABC-type multidrug transport system fused ATPase/permease subunit
LDSETEKYIQESIHRLKGKITLLIVAHRLSTIKEADKIYVLKDGSVVESGDHNDLMAIEGYYRRLVEIQSQGGIVE